MKRTIWTPERDALLTTLAKRYVKHEVATKMNLTFRVVKTRMTQLGINGHALGGRPKGSYNKWSPETEDQLRELVDTHSILQIAVELGFTKDALYAKMRTLGLKAVHHTPQLPAKRRDTPQPLPVSVCRNKRRDAKAERCLYLVERIAYLKAQQRQIGAAA